MAPPLIVLDTLVVVSALVGREDASNYRILAAVETGGVRLALGDDFLRELTRVAGYPDVEPRITSPARALRVGLNTAFMGEHHRPRRLDWPSIPDSGDWWMLDLALESDADYIVTKDRHLDAAASLGFELLTPYRLLARL